MRTIEVQTEPAVKQMAEHIATQIYTEMRNEDSFPAQLHLYRRFDEAKYRKLIRLFNAYFEQVKDNKDVNRAVVGCLYVCEQELSGYLQQFPTANRRLSDAHTEVWRLVEKLWLTNWQKWVPAEASK